MSQYKDTTVSVAPLVLLSVVDHYERILKTLATSTNKDNKRVVGVILGDASDRQMVKVTNSFAIPFEEDEKDPNIWFLDHNFIDSMMEMFKKINAKEKLIGWYHSGPKLRSNDLKINEILKTFIPDPILLIVDVNSTDKIDIPTDCYVAIEDIKEDGSSSEKTFLHLPSVIRAEEAEEIGVGHLLRDIRDQACGNLGLNLTNNFKSLSSLSERLVNIVSYLDKVISGKLPVNNTILGKLQDIFNLFPNISGFFEGEELDTKKDTEEEIKDCDDTELVGSEKKQLTSAFNVKTNDQLMLLYVGSLVRSIIAFHDLIENKIENKKYNERDSEDEKKVAEKPDETDGEGENVKATKSEHSTGSN